MSAVARSAGLGDVRIFKLDRGDRDEARGLPDKGRAIRLYTILLDPRPAGRSTFALQIRGPMNLGSGGRAGDGVDFIVAHAELDNDGLRALRAAIDQKLAEGAAT